MRIQSRLFLFPPALLFTKDPSRSISAATSTAHDNFVVAFESEAWLQATVLAPVILLSSPANVACPWLATTKVSTMNLTLFGFEPVSYLLGCAQSRVTPVLPHFWLGFAVASASVCAFLACFVLTVRSLVAAGLLLQMVWGFPSLVVLKASHVVGEY